MNGKVNGGAYNSMNLSLYAYGANNPVRYVDLDGEAVETVWDAFNVGLGAVSFADNVNEGNYGWAVVDAIGVVLDSAAVVVPFVPGGAGTAIGASRVADKVIDATKTYQTYTKTHPVTGKVYSGRTSGKLDPKMNVLNRDRNHHMNKEGYGPAVLDKSSTNTNAIRGREQQLIGRHGGAKSMGGTSGNAINGISPKNKKIDIYEKTNIEEFGG
jgi:hypothetical protein